MKNSNVTSLGNETLADDGNGPKNSLSKTNQALVEAIRDFVPTWINDYIINVIFAFGILANIVLLMYLIYYKRYKTPVFCVILSLGVADLGVCIGNITYYVFVTPYVTGPLWMCKMAPALTHFTYPTSSYHIAVFAVLRYIQLVYPLKSRSKVTTSLMFKICLAIWCVYFPQAVVSAYFYEAVNISTIEGNDIHTCFFTGYAPIFVPCILILWSFLPFLATSGFHIAKQVVVMISHSATVTSRNERVQQLRRQTDSRALAFVIAAYLITLAPFLVQSFRVYVINITPNPVQVYLVDAFGQIAYMNSAMNPCIYLFAAKSVRNDVKNMLLCNKMMKKDTK